MPRDIRKRLTNLKSRRSGGLSHEALLKSIIGEAYEKRTGQSHTRYTLGAMEEVDKDYTRISVETAERVGNQLNSGLSAAGFLVEFRLQGSVPLNVHIRGVSDVDLLSLDTGFYTYAKAGSLSQAGHYRTPTSRTSVDVLLALRNEAEKILRAKFPAATVDTSGSKAMLISGGSLAREVDVVPSHWYDTVAYQASSAERDRGVTILDKKRLQTVDNFPFLHIDRISYRDTLTLGALKKAIRLCKNVKSDAEDDGTKVSIPSFDIAATMYHANQTALTGSLIYELAVLAETQRHLDWLTTNEAEAQKLMVPDGSRHIFDTREKLDGLRTLSIEMDDLLREVAKEQSPALASITSPTLHQSRDVVGNKYIPST